MYHTFASVRSARWASGMYLINARTRSIGGSAINIVSGLEHVESGDACLLSLIGFSWVDGRLERGLEEGMGTKSKGLDDDSMVGD